MDDPPGRKMHSPRDIRQERISLHSRPSREPHTPGGAGSDDLPVRQRSSIRSPRSSPYQQRLSLGLSPRRGVRSGLPGPEQPDDESSVDLRTRSGFASEDFMSDDGSASRRSVRFHSGPYIPPGERVLTTELLSPRERTRRDDATVRMRETKMRRVLTTRRIMEQNERLRRQQEAADMKELRERARHLRQVRKSLDIQERALARSMRAAEVKQRYNDTTRQRQEECASIAESSAVRCASVAAHSLCEQARVSQRRRTGRLSKYEMQNEDKVEDWKLRKRLFKRMGEEKRMEDKRVEDFRKQMRETTEAGRMRRIENDRHREAVSAAEVRAAKDHFAKQLMLEQEEETKANDIAVRFAARQRAKESDDLRDLCERPAPPPPPKIGDSEYARLCRGKYRSIPVIHTDPAGGKFRSSRPRQAPQWRPPSSG